MERLKRYAKLPPNGDWGRSFFSRELRVGDSDRSGWELQSPIGFFPFPTLGAWVLELVDFRHFTCPRPFRAHCSAAPTLAPTLGLKPLGYMPLPLCGIHWPKR